MAKQNNTRTTKNAKSTATHANTDGSTKPLVSDKGKAKAQLPAGNYPAVITECEIKAKKSSARQYMQLTFEIIDGEYKGRKHRTHLNLVYQNALQSARSELKAICRAIRLAEINEAADLYNRQMIITIRHRRNKDTGKNTAEIKGYHDKDFCTFLSKTQPHLKFKAPWDMDQAISNAGQISRIPVLMCL